MRSAIACLASGLMGLGSACYVLESPESIEFPELPEDTLSLEGEALDEELDESPVHEAPAAFSRLGLLWDADAPLALELSTSADGESWSDWSEPLVQHVEMEETGSFVGQIDARVDGEPAWFVRLRGTDEAWASFARVEYLEDAMGEGIEDGDGSPPGQAIATLGSVTYRTRSDWGADAPNCSTNMNSAWRMAIHHTETPTEDSMSPEARLRAIQSYHQDVQGWCDIGYHFLVSRDGRIWQGRPMNRLGSHAGGANSGNIGIAVLGNHGSSGVSSTQQASISGLLRAVGQDRGIPVRADTVRGHRDYTSTSCPGNALYGQIPALISAAASSASPPPPPPPASSGGSVTVMGVIYEGANTADRIAGATVTLDDGRTTTSSATGFWQFANVPEGTFTVGASAPGYVSGSVTRTTYAAETWSSFGLSLPAPASGNAVLIGVVYHTSNSSNRIPYAQITLSTGHSATADGNGYYQLTGLPAGTVTITASASGWGSESVSRTLADGDTTWGSVRME